MATHERSDGPTPSGGDYSEIFYYDRNNKPCEPEDAHHCIIRECESDGTLIQETFGFCNGNRR